MSAGKYHPYVRGVLVLAGVKVIFLLLAGVVFCFGFGMGGS